MKNGPKNSLSRINTNNTAGQIASCERLDMSQDTRILRVPLCKVIQTNPPDVLSVAGELPYDHSARLSVKAVNRVLEIQRAEF